MHSRISSSQSTASLSCLCRWWTAMRRCASWVLLSYRGFWSFVTCSSCSDFLGGTIGTGWWRLYQLLWTSSTSCAGCPWIHFACCRYSKRKPSQSRVGGAETMMICHAGEHPSCHWLSRHRCWWVESRESCLECRLHLWKSTCHWAVSLNADLSFCCCWNAVCLSL